MTTNGDIRVTELQLPSGQRIILERVYDTERVYGTMQTGAPRVIGSIVSTPTGYTFWPAMDPAVSIGPETLQALATYLANRNGATK